VLSTSSGKAEAALKATRLKTSCVPASKMASSARPTVVSLKALGGTSLPSRSPVSTVEANVASR
jgi:hypothetical protein